MAYIGNQPTDTFVSIDSQSLTGDGTVGPYTLNNAVTNSESVEVFVNFVRQRPGVAYTASGNALTMTGVVASSDNFYVVYQGKAVGTISPPDGSVSTAKIADAAVVTASIADDAVTLAKAADSLYRTGTWTPVIVSGSGSYNGLTTSGTFTRIGNTVHVTARILITASGNASGSMNINNLPFNGYTPAGVRQMIQGRENAQNGYMIQVLINSGTTLGKMQFYDGANCTHTTNYEYIVTGTYQTNDA